MALFFDSDFEDGTPSAAVTTGNSDFYQVPGANAPTYVTGLIGDIGVRSHTTGGNTGHAMIGHGAPTLTDDGYLRFYVRANAAIGAQVYIARFQTQAAVRADLRLNTNGSLQMRTSSANLGSASASGLVSTGAMSRIEWHVGQTVQRLRAFTGANVHGTTPDYDSGDESWTSGGQYDRVAIGCVTNGETVDLTFDEVAADNATWVGPIEIEPDPDPEPDVHYPWKWITTEGPVSLIPHVVT